MNKNITTSNNGKITVLREYGNNKEYCVCQGNSFYGKGLTEGYKEFTDFNSAYEYFNILAN